MADINPGSSPSYDQARLGEIWKRLESLGLRLWEEDRAAAAGLQAIIEEYRGEIARSEQILESVQRALLEQRRTLESSFEAHYGREARQLREQMQAIQKELVSVEENLQKERTRSESLLKRAEAAERMLEEAQDASLKRESELDAKHAAKMRELLERLQGQEAAEESFWLKQRQEWEDERARKMQEINEKNESLKERSRLQESQYQEKIDDLQRKYEALMDNVRSRSDNLNHEYQQKIAEVMGTYQQLKKDLDARESRILEWEAGLTRKELAIQDRSRHLQAEYQLRMEELERTKQDLRSEVSRIVNQYKDKKEPG